MAFLSVRRMLLLCQNSCSHRHNFFTISCGRHSSFWAQSTLHSRGNFSAGEGRKFLSFDRICPLCRIRDGSLIGSHRLSIHPCQIWWPWVTVEGGTRGSNCSADLRVRTLVMFDSERPNSEWWLMGEGGACLERQPHPHIPRGHGPSEPKCFEPST